MQSIKIVILDRFITINRQPLQKKIQIKVEGQQELERIAYGCVTNNEGFIVQPMMNEDAPFKIAFHATDILSAMF